MTTYLSIYKLYIRGKLINELAKWLDIFFKPTELGGVQVIAFVKESLLWRLRNTPRNYIEFWGIAQMHVLFDMTMSELHTYFKTCFKMTFQAPSKLYRIFGHSPECFTISAEPCGIVPQLRWDTVRHYEYGGQFDRIYHTLGGRKHYQLQCKKK